MKITGKKFINLIKKDPSWCLNIKEPIEVTTFTDLANSPITHLSPLLTFSGENESGWVADFSDCKNLKVATGTFNGFVYFGYTGIEKIENLTVKEVDIEGDSASFWGCSNLKVATGNYTGMVNFQGTGVTTIKDLIIKNTEIMGNKASFFKCPIKYIPKEYRGEEFLFEVGLKKKSKLQDIRKDTIKKIKSETNNIII